MEAGAAAAVPSFTTTTRGEEQWRHTALIGVVREAADQRDGTVWRGRAQTLSGVTVAVATEASPMGGRRGIVPPFAMGFQQMTMAIGPAQVMTMRLRPVSREVLGWPY